MRVCLCGGRRAYVAEVELAHERVPEVALAVGPLERQVARELEAVLVAVVVVGLALLPLAVLQLRVARHPAPVALHLQVVAAHPHVACTRARPSLFTDC